MIISRGIMLRQNFLFKLLDLSKSSRFFLLFLTVTFCNVSQVESARLLQKLVSQLGAPQSVEATTRGIPIFTHQSNVSDRGIFSDDDGMESESREYSADGKYYYIVKKYLDGSIRKFGPNPTE